MYYPWNNFWQFWSAWENTADWKLEEDHLCATVIVNSNDGRQMKASVLFWKKYITEIIKASSATGKESIQKLSKNKQDISWDSSLLSL